LDFGGVDVIASTDDEILGTTDDAHVAALVHFADVAGLEPAIGRELLRRLFRHAPIAFEDIGPANFDAADDAGRRHVARLISDTQIHARQREAHRGAATLV